VIVNVAIKSERMEYRESGGGRGLWQKVKGGGAKEVLRMCGPEFALLTRFHSLKVLNRFPDRYLDQYFNRHLSFIHIISLLLLHIFKHQRGDTSPNPFITASVSKPCTVPVFIGMSMIHYIP
jgi:hypothetical protein